MSLEGGDIQPTESMAKARDNNAAKWSQWAQRRWTRAPRPAKPWWPHLRKNQTRMFRHFFCVRRKRFRLSALRVQHSAPPEELTISLENRGELQPPLLLLPPSSLLLLIFACCAERQISEQKETDAYAAGTSRLQHQPDQLSEGERFLWTIFRLGEMRSPPLDATFLVTLFHVGGMLQSGRCGKPLPPMRALPLLPLQLAPKSCVTSKFVLDTEAAERRGTRERRSNSRCPAARTSTMAPTWARST